MSIAVDGHVHIYPCYRVETALACLADNLARFTGDAAVDSAAARIGLLAERSDCRVFRRLYDGSLAVPGWDLSPLSDEGGESVAATSAKGTIYLLPGRQVATSERLEILALMTDEDPSGGRPVEKVIEAVHAAGGLPALNWAPGKWMFGRARIVRNLFARLSPGRLLVCDTSLRPMGWTEPLLMRAARRRGFAVIAGSDPLPFPGQERLVGMYGFVCDTPFEASAPALSLRKALAEYGQRIQRAGRRRSPIMTLLDIAKLSNLQPTPDA